VAIISATWKRTVRVKEYESETLELSVERNLDDAALSQEEVIAAAVALDRDLASAGDALVTDRLEARGQNTSGPRNEVRSPAQLLAQKPQAPDDPDPLV
jgi:hypothetical protein